MLANRNLFRILLILIAIALFNVNSFAKNHQRPFIWADDEDYKPYIYKGSDGKPHGIFKDIMTEIFKRLKIPLRCYVYPWSRAQAIVKSGKADGMVTVYTKKRMKFTKATDPILIIHQKIVARSDNPKIKQILNIKKVEELRNYKVIDSIGAGWAKEHYKNFPNVIWAPNPKNILLMVANGRADIYAEPDLTSIATINELIKKYPQYAKNLKKLVIGKYSLADLKFRLLINKNSPYVKIIPKINTVLKQMKKDGSYNRILKKYLQINK